MIIFASISCPYSSDNGRAKLFTELGCRLLVQMVCQRLSSMKISHSSQQHELTTRDVFLQTRSDLWQSHWLTRTQFAGADMQLQPMTRTCVCCDQHIMQQTWLNVFSTCRSTFPHKSRSFRFQHSPIGVQQQQRCQKDKGQRAADLQGMTRTL